VVTLESIDERVRREEKRREERTREERREKRREEKRREKRREVLVVTLRLVEAVAHAVSGVKPSYTNLPLLGIGYWDRPGAVCERVGRPIIPVLHFVVAVFDRARLLLPHCTHQCHQTFLVHDVGRSRIKISKHVVMVCKVLVGSTDVWR
jgi:hypothetical protein